MKRRRRRFTLASVSGSFSELNFKFASMASSCSSELSTRLARVCDGAWTLDATLAVASNIDNKPEKPLRVVGFGLKRLPLSTARTSMRLDDAWVEKLRKARPGRSQVLSVAHLAHTQQSFLREGDLLLSMNGTYGYFCGRRRGL